MERAAMGLVSLRDATVVWWLIGRESAETPGWASMAVVASRRAQGTRCAYAVLAVRVRH
jgi:hypothetical protein